MNYSSQDGITLLAQSVVPPPKPKPKPSVSLLTYPPLLPLRLENPLCESYGLTAEQRAGRPKISPSLQRKNPPSVGGALTLSQHLARAHKRGRINKWEKEEENTKCCSSNTVLKRRKILFCAAKKKQRRLRGKKASS